FGSGEQMPVINGAELITGWEQHAADIYKVSLAIRPWVVIKNGEFLWSINNIDNLQPNRFHWDNTNQVLYIHSAGGNPDALGLAIEAGQRNHGIEITAKPYVRVKGIRIEKTNSASILLRNNSHHAWIDSCHLRYANSGSVDGAGVHCNGNPYSRVSHTKIDTVLGDGVLVQASIHVSVENCEINGIFRGKNSGGDGVQFFQSSHYARVLGTFISLNGTDVPKGCIQLDQPTDHALMSGNTLLYGNFGIGVNGSHCRIEKNYIAHQGIQSGDTWAAPLRFGGSLTGSADSEDNQFSYNVLVGSINYAMDILDNNKHSNFHILNNTVVKCLNGIKISGTVSGRLQNNLIWIPGGNNPLSVGSIITSEGWVSDYNLISPNYNKPTGRDENSISQAPIFVDADQDDYRLAAGSPGLTRG
ncbi:MAG: hypothetical protein HC842_03195, partial [Cytophagales bacterium]|nr:hypothetical protein [Cytophagales bacterium]